MTIETSTEPSQSTKNLRVCVQCREVGDLEQMMIECDECGPVHIHCECDCPISAEDRAEWDRTAA